MSFNVKYLLTVLTPLFNNVNTSCYRLCLVHQFTWTYTAWSELKRFSLTISSQGVYKKTLTSFVALKFAQIKKNTSVTSSMFIYSFNFWFKKNKFIKMWIPPVRLNLLWLKEVSCFRINSNINDCVFHHIPVWFLVDVDLLFNTRFPESTTSFLRNWLANLNTPDWPHGNHANYIPADQTIGTSWKDHSREGGLTIKEKQPRGRHRTLFFHRFSYCRKRLIIASAVTRNWLLVL